MQALEHSDNYQRSDNPCALQSTLMRAISNGQVDGFPPPEELRTVYVEHDIDASESEQAVIDFIHNDPTLQGKLLLIHFAPACCLRQHLPSPGSACLHWQSIGAVIDP